PPPARAPTRDDFETLALSGTGEYGRVLMVRYVYNGQIYAMKVIAKTNLVLRGQTSIAQAIAESEILQTVRHPYIVSLHFAFQDQEHLYLVMDYAGGGDLFALIEAKRTLPENWIKMYAAEVVMAIEHCHSQAIVYRDLKPENIMVGLDGHLMLTDFGLAKRLRGGTDPRTGNQDDARRGSNTTGTICGTPSYLAPEILKGEKYGFAVDWWTVGCLIYEMATGETPFRGASLVRL
ncbi:kinase-like domain-containing protein, partial [Pavlovales sp. CCMP2436]